MGYDRPWYWRYPTGGAEVSETVSYTVPGIHCAHCEAALKRELEPVAGVESVDVDLEQKRVSVQGTSLDDAALRAAIDEAGYDIAS
jgi:copper chaperone CopZ